MDSYAARLAGAIDGLAGALRRAGAPEAESARLLELAATAALQALALREELRPPAPVATRGGAGRVATRRGLEALTE